MPGVSVANWARETLLCAHATLLGVVSVPDRGITARERVPRRGRWWKSCHAGSASVRGASDVVGVTRGTVAPGSPVRCGLFARRGGVRRARGDGRPLTRT
jgi:hypothetical protein